MPAKLFKSGSNVADLITSAGLLGNSLVKVCFLIKAVFKNIEISKHTFKASCYRRTTTARRMVRPFVANLQEGVLQTKLCLALTLVASSFLLIAHRYHVSRSSSAEAPAPVAKALLGKSPSCKQQPSISRHPSSKQSVPEQYPQEACNPAKHSISTAQAAASPSISADHAANFSSKEDFQINAAKPNLLAQLQAVRLQEPVLISGAGSIAAAPEKQAHDERMPVLQHSLPTASGALQWFPSRLLPLCFPAMHLHICTFFVASDPICKRNCFKHTHSDHCASFCCLANFSTFHDNCTRYSDGCQWSRCKHLAVRH